MKTETFTLVDQKSRDIISHDVTKNLIVEAGAGSGKTTEMANRIIALIQNGYRTIDQLAAITFTKKAANELQERVRNRLVDAWEKTGNPYLKAAIENYHECFIGTIHAYCSKLLRERPIEAGVDPEFVEIEDGEDHAILEKVWENFVFHADEERKQLLALKNEFSVKEDVMRNFLKTVCENQDVAYTVTDANILTVEQAEELVEKTFSDAKEELEYMKKFMPEGVTLATEGIDGLQRIILRLEKQTQNRKDLTITEKWLFLKNFRFASHMKITQKAWVNENDDKATKKACREKAKQITAEMREFRENTVLPALNSIDKFIYGKILIPFADFTKKDYIEYKNETAKLNFQDLLIKTADMLQNNSDIRAFFQKKYKTLLVDEFQDTDPIQAQILMYLTSCNPEEQNWTKCIPHEGSLFVVGDPKQSIYAFRRADIEIYNKFKEILIASGGECVELTTNFRAVKDLEIWYNDTFEVLMNEKEYSEEFGIENNAVKQAQFVKLNGIHNSLPNTLTGVNQYFIHATTNSDIIKADAESIKRIINWMVGKKDITVSKIDGNQIIYDTRKVEYRDIMILSMKKKHIAALAKSLSQFNIPVKVTGADVIAKTPSFSVLANVIKMLAYPEENAYLFQVLSSYPFALTVNDLFRYKGVGGSFYIYFDNAKLLENKALKEDLREIIKTVDTCYHLLQRFVSYAKEIPFASLVERIIEEMGLQRNLYSTPEKSMEISGFSSIIEKIKLKDIADLWGHDLFIREIENMFESGFEEENDIVGGDYNAVRMMNIHKAKGLEAPIVILAIPCSGSFGEADYYIERIDEENSKYRGHLRINANPDMPYTKQFIESDEWHKFAPLAALKHRLEYNRILYVAATRARNMLIVSNSSSKENPWGDLCECMTQDSDDILESVIANEENDQNPKNIAAKTTGADMLEMIAKANDFRNTAIKENCPTYKQIIPSAQDSSKNAMEITDAVRDKIASNTIRFSIEKSDKPDETAFLRLGTAVHKLFEKIVNGMELRDICEQIEKESNTDLITHGLLEEIGNTFMCSPLYDRIKNADEKYTEVPFAYKTEEMGHENYVHGFMDLIMRENDRWTIVDYKTCSKDQVKSELYQYYSGQLNLYKQALSKVVDSDHIDWEIFFVEKE